MNQKVLDFLKSKGYSNVESSYYNYIKLWEEFWKGKTSFHKYYDFFGTEREMYSLGMAKQVPEDWSSILWNEDMEIHSDDEQTDRIIPAILKDVKFYKKFPEYINKAFYSGTCGIVTRIKNAIVSNNGITKGPKTKINLIGITADKIIPLTVDDGKITEVAFVSEVIKKSKKYYYIEMHLIKNDKDGYYYEISNIYLDESGEEVEMEGIVKTFTTSKDIPLFCCLMPNLDNPLDCQNGLGYSVLGDAIDQLKGVDIAYHNFVMDSYLGGKKIFYNKKVVKYRTETIKKDDGTTETIEVPVFPDDIAKQQFATYGDEMENINDNPVLKEYNPDLRTEDNEKTIQMALNLLSLKVGLGRDYYRFDRSSGVVTATQYLGDRQDLVSTAKKHMDNIEDCVKEILKSLLYIYRTLMNEEVNEEFNINVVRGDGFLTSTEEQKEEFKTDISMGIRSRTEYRMKFFGEDEKTASEKIALINEEDSISNLEV